MHKDWLFIFRLVLSIIFFTLIKEKRYFFVNSERTFAIDYKQQTFLKDNKPFRYISGELHYFRIHSSLWADRIQRVRSAGLNAIQVYVPWNFHERLPKMSVNFF